MPVKLALELNKPFLCLRITINEKDILRHLNNPFSQCYSFFVKSSNLCLVRLFAIQHSWRLFFLNLFGCTGSQLRLMVSLVVACKLLVAACMWDLVPGPRIEPSPPALGVQVLTTAPPRGKSSWTLFHDKLFAHKLASAAR